MNLLCAALVLSFAGAHGGWTSDAIGQGSVDVGGGLRLKVQELKSPNSSFLEGHVLRADYGSYGVSVGKALNRDAVELGFHIGDGHEQGRGKQDRKQVAMFIGYKVATVIFLSLAVMAALTVKALFIAKFALIASSLLLVQKLFHGGHHGYVQHHGPAYVELDHAPESHAMAEYPVTASAASEGAYQPSGTANYYAYSNYVPTAMADNSLTYVESPGANASAANVQQVASSRRRDLSRKKPAKIPMITVHRYSLET